MRGDVKVMGAIGKSAAATLALAMLAIVSRAADVFVECESFAELGGWVVDAYSMRGMGSAYVMAHGCGRPVADAVGSVSIPQEGLYAVWARTRNWNAEWTKGAAGLFKVKVNGTELSETLGVGDSAWHWQKAGEVEIPAGRAEVALHDLTGFNGRCDALFLTTARSAIAPYQGATAGTRDACPYQVAAAAEKVRASHRGKIEDDREAWDMVVVGGGVAGCCAALSASRYKLKTLLLQDRGVLGGCNSSEIRVSAGGFMHKGPYPALGNVLEEILPVRGDYVPLPEKFYEDDRKANAFAFPEATARLKLNKYVYAVETNAAGRIVAVVSRDTRTGRDMRHRAKWFVDATGDGVIARLAGCETMYGREERARWNEACAPVKADRQVMGHSIQWKAQFASEDSPFPDIDWSLPFTEETVRYVRGGLWWQEAGQYRDMAEETEAIRDYGLLAIFSNWNFIKNHSARRAEWRRMEIKWMSPIGGKRESHRVVGDYVLTEADLEGQRKFDDGTAVVTWDIDFHFPEPENERQFKEPFRSCAYHRGFGPPVAVPYRCLYARDAPNLFLAGRDISTSHGAFAAVRVQRTLGMLGEVVGIAAGICKEKNCDPRDVYATHLSVLKERMERGVPKQYQYCAFGGGMHEKYHFADLGFVSIWPNPATNITPRTAEAIRSLGMVHRHPHPLVDGEAMPTVATDSQLRCDVAVVGGGSAGFAAAWSAAKCGADVVLVEREDSLGGTSTVGGVSSWEPVCGAQGLPELLYERLKKEGLAGVYRFAHHCSWPEKDGTPQFPGALLEIDNDAPYSVTLRRHGPGMKDEKWFRENCRGVIFDPDAMSRTMREMLGETGRCRVMTGTSFVSAERDGGRITTLRLSDGTVLEPKVVVDACGAASMAVGCELLKSERPNGASLIYRVARSADTVAPNDSPPPCWWMEHYPSAFCMTLPNGEVAVNMLPTMSGEEVRRLGESAAYEEARRRVEAHWRWMQTRWPAFAAWRICRMSKILAIRDSFRVRGDYVLTGGDVRDGVRPFDEIASADHALDAHGGEGFGGELKAPYGIPYRCLVAARMENLLLAGRIASFDSVAATSCRLSRTMMKLGEAAGAAAALAARSGRTIRAVGAPEILAVVERNEKQSNEEE